MLFVQKFFYETVGRISVQRMTSCEKGRNSILIYGTICNIQYGYCIILEYLYFVRWFLAISLCKTGCVDISLSDFFCSLDYRDAACSCMCVHAAKSVLELEPILALTLIGGRSGWIWTEPGPGSAEMEDVKSGTGSDLLFREPFEL